MTYKERVQQHKKELETKQIELSSRLNELFQNFDYLEIKNSAHLKRLLTTTAYRKRDIAAIDRMLNDNKYLATQMIVTDYDYQIMDYNTVKQALDEADERIEKTHLFRVSVSGVVLNNFKEMLSRYTIPDVTQEEIEEFARRRANGSPNTWELFNITIPRNAARISNLFNLLNIQLTSFDEQEIAKRLLNTTEDVLNKLQRVMFMYEQEESVVPYTDLSVLLVGDALDLPTAQRAGDLEYDDESWEY